MICGNASATGIPKKGEEWWETAVAVISQAEHGLNLDAIHWLEWRCILVAQEIELQHKKVTEHAWRFHKPQYTPDELSIGNAMQGAMSGLFDSLCTLVSVLGYPVFEPLEDIDCPSVQDEISVSDSGEVFRCCGKDADATGVWVQNQFMVLKGSVARLQIAPHAKETVGRKRKPLVDAGILVEDGEKLRFAKDHKFKSPSGAAAVVLGRSADGWIEWENRDGKPLGEIVQRGDGEQAGCPVANSDEDAEIPVVGDGPRPEWVFLKDLIDAGILKPPLKVTKCYRGTDLEADLLPTGVLKFQETEYTAPSSAAKAVTGKPTDGWHFWQYRDKDGNWVSCTWPGWSIWLTRANERQVVVALVD